MPHHRALLWIGDKRQLEVRAVSFRQITRKGFEFPFWILAPARILRLRRLIAIGIPTLNAPPGRAQDLRMRKQ